jgi:hypothetical protein
MFHKLLVHPISGGISLAYLTAELDWLHLLD